MQTKDLVSKKTGLLGANGDEGFALLNVVVIAGIVLAGVGYSLNMMDQRISVMKILRMSSQMDILEDRIKNASISNQALFQSAKKAPSSSNFYKCLVNSFCSAATGVSFSLFNSQSEPISGYFDLNGKPCTNPKTQFCAIEAAVTYDLVCPNGAATCTKPDKITTYYVVRQNDKNALKGRVFGDRKGSSQLALFSCDAGEYVYGVTATGTLTCAKPVSALYASTCSANEVAFGITKEGELKCMQVTNFCGKPLTLVTVLDTSGSMISSNKIGNAKDGAKQLIDEMDAFDAGGLVTFSSKAIPQKPPDNNWWDTKKRIDGLKPAGNTNMTDGLIKAMDYLKAINTSYPKGIVFLSDGWHNSGPRPEAWAAANIKSKGIHIWTIGFGAAADTRTLQALATTPSDYFYAANNAALKQAFNSIAEYVCRKK